MIYLILFTLIGVNIAPIFLPKFYPFAVHGYFMTLMILIMLAWSFIEKSSKEPIVNKWIGIFYLWCVINTLIFHAIIPEYHQYKIGDLGAFVNLTLMIIFYRILVEYLNLNRIVLILKAFRWVILVTLFICVLQNFHLGQFFIMLYKDHIQFKDYFNNPVFGFLGQPTQQAGFLASCIPLFLYEKNRQNYLTLILLWIILLFFTGTSNDDLAMNGIVVGIIVTLYFLFYDLT